MVIYKVFYILFLNNTTFLVNNSLICVSSVRLSVYTIPGKYCSTNMLVALHLHLSKTYIMVSHQPSYTFFYYIFLNLFVVQFEILTLNLCNFLSVMFCVFNYLHYCMRDRNKIIYYEFIIYLKMDLVIYYLF